MQDRSHWIALTAFGHLNVAILCTFIVLLQAPPDAEYVDAGPPRFVPGRSARIDDNQIEPPEMRLGWFEDPVIYKTSGSDHTETANDDLFQKARGETLDGLFDHAYRGKLGYTVTGAGNAAAVKYGGRFGGAKFEVFDREFAFWHEEAATHALLWLARHQDPDGSWSVVEYTRQCVRVHEQDRGCDSKIGNPTFGTGVTGLALLALLGTGRTHLSRDALDGVEWGAVIRKGLQHLVRIQDPSGQLGPRDCPKAMYNHMLAGLALIEGYRLSKSDMIREAAQKALDFALECQNPGKGWRYTPRAGENDTFVTAWGFQLLSSAKRAGLQVPQNAFEGCLAWFDEATDRATGRVGYLSAAVQRSVVPGVTDHMNPHPTMTAAATTSRLLAGMERSDSKLDAASVALVQHRPKWDSAANEVDFCCWYFGTLALHLMSEAIPPKYGTPAYTWFEAIEDGLRLEQLSGNESCARGSWNPVDPWSSEGGRVYVTAMGALILETPFRARLLQK